MIVYYKHILSKDFTDWLQRLQNKRFCFVEMDNEIIIENEGCGLEYYFNKVPVYNYRGQLMNPRFLLDDLKVSSREDFFNTGFNPLLIKILGLRINTPKLEDSDINNGIEKISEHGKIILKRHYKSQDYNRYSIQQHMCTILNKIIDTDMYYNNIMSKIPSSEEYEKQYEDIVKIDTYDNNHVLDLLDGICTDLNDIIDNVYKDKEFIYLKEYSELNKLQIDYEHNINDDISQIYIDLCNKKTCIKHKSPNCEFKYDNLKDNKLFNDTSIDYYNNIIQKLDKITQIKYIYIKKIKEIKEKSTYVKYLKYKKKYIELKSKLNNKLGY